MRPLEIARDYISRGWAPIPVGYKSKHPTVKDWTRLRVSLETIDHVFGSKDLNVGVLLGEPSGGLIDMDLDCPEAVQLAPLYLPATLCFGRKSKPKSHWLYICAPAPETEKFVADDNAMILELRSTGCQTIFPGSVHPGGEEIDWETPSAIEPKQAAAGDLRRAARRLAAAALLLRSWHEGSRDDVATALSGGLLRDGWKPEDVDEFIGTICEAAGDSDAKSRLKATRLVNSLGVEGTGRVPGWPTLERVLGTAKATKLRAWLVDEDLIRRGLSQISEAVAEMNAAHAVIPLGATVRILNETVDPKTGWRKQNFLARSDFQTLYMNRKLPVDGKPKTLADIWLNHPLRRQYKGVIFEPLPPGQTRDVPGYYNLWQGFAVTPTQGDCALYLEHLRNVICSGNELHFHYLIAWMADAIQRPADRPGVAIVLRGRQGTGKGKMVEWFGKLFGPHFIQVTSPHHLLGHFNAHLEDKVVVFADEAFWAGDRASEGKLKGMITESSQMVERKGVDAIFVRNHVRLIAASNQDWVVPAGFEERRFFVLDVSDAKMQDHSYFAGIDKQMTEGGLQALMDQLLRLDLSKLNLRIVPQTSALLEQKLQSMPLIDKWWYERLRAGTLRDTDDQWASEPIPTGDLYQLFRNHAKLGAPRYIPDLTSFAMRFHKIVPKLELKRITPPYGTKRVRAYVIPSLAACRQHFAKLLRAEIDWPEGSAATRTQIEDPF